MSKMEDLRNQRKALERLVASVAECQESIKQLEVAVDKMGPIMSKYRNMDKAEFQQHLMAVWEVYEERRKEL